jgi:hypothetical protein
MTAFQKFDPHTFLKRERGASDRAQTFATFVGRPPKNGICGTASEVLSQSDTSAVAAKSIEIPRDHPAVEHDLGKNQNLTPIPAKVAKAAKDDNNFRNFRSPPSVFDGGTLPAIEEEARCDRFDERAAILEFDEGLPRAEAEAVARQGVADVYDGMQAKRDAAPYASALAVLHAQCPAYVPEDRWHQAIADAAAFANKWGAEAQACGWTVPELFGLPQVPERPAANYSRLSRLDGVGLIWLLHGRSVVTLTSTEAVTRPHSGATLTFRRRNEPAPLVEIAKGATA